MELDYAFRRGEPPPSEQFAGCVTIKAVNERYRELFVQLQEQHGLYPSLDATAPLMEDARRAMAHITRGSGKPVAPKEADEPRPVKPPKSTLPQREPGKCVRGHNLRELMEDGKSVQWLPPNGKGSPHCRLCQKERYAERKRLAEEAKASGNLQIIATEQ